MLIKNKSTSQSAPARRSPWLAVVLKRRRLGEGVFFNGRVLVGLFTLLASVFLTLLGFGTFSNVSAQENLGHESIGHMTVIHPYHHDVSRPLREQPLIWPVKMGEEREANPNPKIPHQHLDSPDPVIQNSFL